MVCAVLAETMMDDGCSMLTHVCVRCFVCSGLLATVGLGSVSDHCVHALHCPTVVVKDSDGDAHATNAAAAKKEGGGVCGGTSVSGTKA